MGAFVASSSTLTINNSWTEGWTTGKRRTCLNVTIVLSSQGSATNNIPAIQLGLDSIEEATAFVKSDSSQVWIGCPDATGANLLISTVSSSTLIPTDISATVTGTVKGPIYHG